MKGMWLCLMMCWCFGTALGGAGGAPACCAPGQLIQRGGNCTASGRPSGRIAVNCTVGYMVLRDPLLDGRKLSTLDTPSFVFSEDPSQYCLGPTSRNASDPEAGNMTIAVVCFEESFRENDLETSGALTLVSVLFLLATFAVYMHFPELRDLQGLCYMCMCISMALGFLSLGILQLSHGFRGELCAVTGFLVYFWLMATFFWMNVISINMYRTILNINYLKKTERQQYMMYSTYAWGGSVSFLVIALITNFAEGDHWKPGITGDQCWFTGRTETWIYFYGPIAVLIFANAVLFLCSSVRLWKQNKNYEVNTLNILKHKFVLSFKLFLVMGMSWVFEIASFAHGASHIIWTIMDTFNCLQGVVIFLLLVVLRRRAVRALAAAGCCRECPSLAHRLLRLHPPPAADASAVLSDDELDHDDVPLPK